jgi:hypothetical protein
VGSKAGLEAGGEENSQPLPGLEHPIIKSVAQRYTTEISRLCTSSSSSSSSCL